MQVTSTKSITFPKLGWAITAGDIKELPEDEGAQKMILKDPAIKKVEITKNNKSIDKK